MSSTRTLTKAQAQKIDMILNGWIPLQVFETTKGVFRVNSASTIGHFHIVKANPVLGLTCSHEYTEHNDHNPCSHIRAVQELLLSGSDYLSFDQELHVLSTRKGLQATKTKKQWEWMITDSRGGSVGCIGVTINSVTNSAEWWATYEGNSAATWDNCLQALEYLVAIVSF